MSLQSYVNLCYDSDCTIVYMYQKVFYEMTVATINVTVQTKMCKLVTGASCMRVNSTL